MLVKTDTITIKVSKGIEKVVVPDLTGKTEAEAKKMISDNVLMQLHLFEYKSTKNP